MFYATSTQTKTNKKKETATCGADTKCLCVFETVKKKSDLREKGYDLTQQAGLFVF